MWGFFIRLFLEKQLWHLFVFFYNFPKSNIIFLMIRKINIIQNIHSCIETILKMKTPKLNPNSVLFFFIYIYSLLTLHREMMSLPIQLLSNTQGAIRASGSRLKTQTPDGMRIKSAIYSYWTSTLTTDPCYRRGSLHLKPHAPILFLFFQIKSPVKLFHLQNKQISKTARSAVKAQHLSPVNKKLLSCVDETGDL